VQDGRSRLWDERRKREPNAKSAGAAKQVAPRWLAAGSTGDAIFGLLSTQTCLRLRRPGPSRDDGWRGKRGWKWLAVPRASASATPTFLLACRPLGGATTTDRDLQGDLAFSSASLARSLLQKKKGRYECHVWEACSCSQRPPGGRSGSGTAAWARPRRGVPQISDIAMRSRLPSRGQRPGQGTASRLGGIRSFVADQGNGHGRVCALCTLLVLVDEEASQSEGHDGAGGDIVGSGPAPIWRGVPRGAAGQETLRRRGRWETHGSRGVVALL
jgi:hypothetical protein